MRISGFTFARNATKLYYPVRASIESLLPLVDEMVVALAEGDDDDYTRAEIERIGSDKIRIIDTVWDLKKYPNGLEYAHQTDVAKAACTGEWLVYLQCDEAIHEQYHDRIRGACRRFAADETVEGFLLKYKHFYGDFRHYHISHDWYPKEIRVIRNNPNIHSWRDAQSFRFIENFDGVDYYRKAGTRKLRVVEIDAEVFHYGFVRPPELMAKKNRNVSITYTLPAGKQLRGYSQQTEIFDYGPLNRLATFDGTHPSSMREWIEKFDWQDQLQYEGRPNPRRKKHKHETLKDRALTWIEQHLLGGRLIGGFKNYVLLKNKK